MKASDLDFKSMRIIVLHRDNYVCQICKVAEATDADHIWPRALGGKDRLDNLQAACGPCNKSKGDRIYTRDITCQRAEWTSDQKFGAALDQVREAARWLAIMLAFYGDPEPTGAQAYDRFEFYVPDDSLENVLDGLARCLGVQDPQDPTEAYGFLSGMAVAA